MSPRIAEATVPEHRAAVVGRLLDACGVIAADRGIDAISLGSAAGAAGISRSSIYTYVENRDDLIRMWGEREMRRFLAQVDLGFERRSATPGRELERLLFEVLTELSTRPQVSAASEATISAESKALMMEHLKPLADRFEYLLEAGASGGEFRSDAAESLAYLLACLDVERRAIDDGESAERSARRLVRFVLAALRRPDDAGAAEERPTR
ncbi:TetR/AcrR family transcriptional regulator [Agromyces mangrovi Wang et al. 2018]|uniref:TetR/AcrR family transcriptional regulator n=1 Tax=Agromyces mangrovi TaxID=1858653 RepID=UPI00257320D1|nr:TetR/AcrR family transcriptional regulator [Agromyces mangrovi]BDZ64956.1 hypothetical protein GCM10025877_18940 [Agromyces mangrovi]